MKPIQSWNFEIPEVVEVKPITTLCILTYQERTLFSKLEKLKTNKGPAIFDSGYPGGGNMVGV